MRIFKTKWFVRYARKEGIRDNKLIKAVREIEKGLDDGQLGGGLIKKRVARYGEGKSGSYRTIIVYRTQIRSVFVYAFPKNAKANLSAEELDGYKKLAREYLRYSNEDIAEALLSGELKEVDYNEKEI